MRTGIKTMMLVVAAALVAAAPAQAQRQSLADRVGALEAQVNNSQANADMLSQLQQLRTELQALQGAIEQLQHENEQLKQRGRDQYLDLDGRLNRLEGGSVAPQAQPEPAKPAAASVEKAPTVRGDAGAVAAAGDERAAYNVAFDALKGGKYDESARLFQGFLEQYPNGVYAPNALYWLGESYYTSGEYEKAARIFAESYKKYPKGPKVADSLLKMGMSLGQAGKKKEACVTLKQLKKEFTTGGDAVTLRRADQEMSRLACAN